MPSISSRSLVALSGFALALATTGCEAIHDFADKVYEQQKGSGDSSGPAPGGAPIDQKPPVGPVDPGPVACASSESCAAGQHCSVEDGDCKSPPGCGGDKACPAVCYGVCVADAPAGEPCGKNVCKAGEFCCNASCGICAPKGGACTLQFCGDPVPPKPEPPKGEACGAATCKPGLVCCNASCGICVEPGQGCTKQLCPTPPPPAAECVADADCKAVANYCGGCNCEAIGKGDVPTTCQPEKQVQCFAEGCINQAAFCKAGQCVLGSKTPPAPPPPTKCEKRTQGGPTSCKDAATWKLYAHEDCKASGLVLTEYHQRETCGIVAGSSVYVDYVCCAP
jgi:hypothetical protein